MQPQLSWWDRCVGLVDRLFASPRFQRWATGFPLTRPIARRRARGLFDLVAGFVYSQVLFAAVRLHLFDLLGEGPQTVADLAPRLGLPEPGRPVCWTRRWRCGWPSAAAVAVTGWGRSAMPCSAIPALLP